MRRTHHAHGGEPRLEGLQGVRGAEQRELRGAVGEVGVLPVAIADRAAREVHVGVDQSGEDGERREIDDGGATRDRDVRARCGDPLALDEDHGVLHGRAAGAVNQRAGLDGRDGCRLLREERGRQEQAESRGAQHPYVSFSLSLPKTPPGDAWAVSASANSNAVA